MAFFYLIILVLYFICILSSSSFLFLSYYTTIHIYYSSCDALLPFVLLHVLLASSDGRLYRCDVTPTLSNGALRSDEPESEEDWEEREASRTHSVKFTDPQDQDNREVRSETHCSLWVWFSECINHNIRRSDSYYVLSPLPEGYD